MMLLVLLLLLLLLVRTVKIISKLTDDLEKPPVLGELHDPAVAVPVRHEEDPRLLRHRQGGGLAEVGAVGAGDELLAQHKVGLGGAGGEL